MLHLYLGYNFKGHTNMTKLYAYTTLINNMYTITFEYYAYLYIKYLASTVA